MKHKHTKEKSWKLWKIIQSHTGTTPSIPDIRFWWLFADLVVIRDWKQEEKKELTDCKLAIKNKSIIKTLFGEYVYYS